MLFSVIVAIDAGVDTGWKERVGEQHQKRCTARFSKDVQGEPVCVSVNDDAHPKREDDGQCESQIEVASRLFFVAQSLPAGSGNIPHEF